MFVSVYVNFMVYVNNSEFGSKVPCEPGYNYMIVSLQWWVVTFHSRIETHEPGSRFLFGSMHGPKLDPKWTMGSDFDLHPVNLGLALNYRKACGSSEFTIMLIQGLLDWMSNKRFRIYGVSLSYEQWKEWNSTVGSPIGILSCSKKWSPTICWIYPNFSEFWIKIGLTSIRLITWLIYYSVQAKMYACSH